MISATRARRCCSWALWPLLVLLGPGCRGDEDRDSVAPEIKFTYPNEYTILNAVETIRVLARDNTGINRVVFVAEGDTLLITATAPYSLTWNTSAYPDCTTADSYLELLASVEDLAGNTSSTSRKFYTLNRPYPPVPVELNPPAQISKHSVELSWEQSVDWYFSHYVLFRDTVNTVSETSDSLVRFMVPDSTSFTDRGPGVSPFGLLEDTDYYYRVWVYDENGKGTGSDSAALMHTLLPQPAKLLAPSPVTKYTVGLQWLANTEDVLYYRLHRGQFDSTALADTNFVPPLDSVAAITSGLTTYLDTGLAADTTYFYYLYLIDSAGYTHLFEQYDMIAVQTMNIPAAVLRDPPQSVTKYSAIMTWEDIAEQEDPSRIILYRAETTSVDTDDVIVYDQPNGAGLSFSDNQLQQGRLYSYRLYHRDTRNNRAWSNTVTITTRNLADVWTGALGVSKQDKYELGLGWDTYIYSGENDFAGYTLTRDGQTIFTSATASTNSYSDQGLSKNTVYNYQLTVADTSGATVTAPLPAATRDIYPAELISLETTEAWQFLMGWLPSDEPSGEFAGYKVLRTTDMDETFTDRDDVVGADCVASGNCTDVTDFTQQLPSGDDTTLVYTDGDPNLLRLTAYNYCVLTYDLAGGYAPSNIKGDTLLTVPDAVELSIPDSSITKTTIRLVWTQVSWGSAQADAQAFNTYEVWRNGIKGERPGADGSGYELLYPIGDITTTYTVTGDDLSGGAVRYYIIIVKDTFGQLSYSNEVEGGTLP